MMSKNIIDKDLMFRFFRDEQTPGEAERLGEWLQEDPAHENAFRQAFEAFQADRLLLERKRFSMRSIGKWIGMAAACAAALAAGVFLDREFSAKPAQEQLSLLSSQVCVQETKPGDQVRITLPDGTLVHLNACSKLEYFAVYNGGERRVKLSGEALFDVVADAANPFTVETSGYDVTATGTRFNVSADAMTGDFTTTLMRGKVFLRDRSGKEVLHLEPGQSATLSDGTLAVDTVEDAEEASLWSQGVISVSGIPFDQLMKQFERSYGVRIVIDRKQLPTVHYGMAKVRISNGVEYALNLLQKRSDFRYRYDEDTQTYHIF